MSRALRDKERGPRLTQEAQGVQTLSRHTFDSNSMITSREAAKCLANVLLLESKTRQMFVDFGYPVKAAQRLKVGPMPVCSMQR